MRANYILLFLIFLSCGSDDLSFEEQINEYITANNISQASIQTQASGLQYIIIEPGSETKPTADNTITISYLGSYYDGEVFDANDEATFPLSRLIQGWQLGIPLIGEGGKIKLIVPPNLGYGSNPPQGIRSNAILFFDVELFEFE